MQKGNHLLHELFARFGVVDCIVSNNGSQFMSSEFKKFCQTFSVEHITIAQYHPRSNGPAERFVDTFKRALRKARDTPTAKAIQHFLQVYRVTPNKNAPSAMLQAEVIFARKITSVFGKLLPNQSKSGHTKWLEYDSKWQKCFSTCFKATSSWETGTGDKQIGIMIYIIKGAKHMNQIKNRNSKSVENNPREEDPMDVVFDTFEVPIPQSAPE